MLYSNRLLETISSQGLRAAALTVGPLQQKHFVGISLLFGQGGGTPTHNTHTHTHIRSLPGWHHKEAEAFFSLHLNENTRSSSDTSLVWEECAPPFVGFHFTLSTQGVSGWLCRSETISNKAQGLAVRSIGRRQSDFPTSPPTI